MSQSILLPEKSFTTGASSLATKQYYLMKQHTDGTLIIAAAATDSIVGVLQNKPVVGAAALVRFSGTSKVIAGGAIPVGAFVTSNASGQAVATTTAGDVVIGVHLGTAAAASGDVIEIMLCKFKY